MKMYYVHKKDWDHYMEDRGCIVSSDSPDRAKGIGMAKMNCHGEPKKNIVVEEIDLVSEGVLCMADYILNTTEHN